MAAKRKPVEAAEPPARLPTREEQLAVIEHKKKAIARLIAAKKSRDSLLEFTRFTMPNPDDIDDASRSLFETNWHHEAICELLQKVERGEILRAIITMPPRTGKSELCSRRFIPWFVGRDPYRQTIFATYGQEFADDFGRKAREIVRMPAYRQVFPGVELKSESKSANRQETNAGGMMVWLGVGGPATGRGADLLVVDDPIKLRAEAESFAHRNMIWDWFTSVAYTRLMPGGRIVVVLTRWHEDDIVGRIFNPDYVDPKEAAKWYRLDLPAIINEGKIDEALAPEDRERALWPGRFPLEVLKSTRAFIGDRDFTSLYQQKPSPPEGVFFHKDQIFTYREDELPKNARHYMTGDLALTEDKKNDETCVGQWLVDENDTLFLSPDLIWERKTADRMVEKIIDKMQTFEPMSTWWEKGQIDRAVGPFLKKRMAERGVFTFLTALPLNGNKGQRAVAIRGRMAQGKVRFPAFAPWWPRAKDQLLKFTGSGDDAEDDFVDMCSIAGQALGKQLRGEKPGVERQGNVYKVGTFGWIKHDSDYRKRQAELAKRRGGF